jgi:nucleoside-diphosphate-sugar epimerase
MSRKLIILTGAGGFIGRRLAQRFDSSGWEVRALVRDPARNAELLPICKGGLHHHELSEEVSPDAFRQEDYSEVVTIHCAHEMGGGTNYEGSMRLYEKVRKLSQSRFVYISSMAAHEKAESDYGRSKLKVEKSLDLDRDLVVKPGTVIGQGGLFARISTLARKLPVIPVFYGSKKLQTIEIADLCFMTEKLIANGRTGIVPLAHPDATSIRDFYSLLIAHLKAQTRVIPVSAALALPAVRALEAVGLSLPITSDNLLGLKCLQYFEVGSVNRELEIQPKDYRQSLLTL